MNTATNNQLKEETFVSINPETTPVVKYCTNCKTELRVSDDIRHTSFGLCLCEDCLYM